MTDLEFEIIQQTQSLKASGGPAIDVIFQVLTELGYGPLYLVVIMVLYWAGRRHLAMRLSVLLLLSAAVNSILKMLIHAPRPYWLKPELFIGSGDGAAGMPSGHAQAATVFWTGLAIAVKRWWFWLLAVFVIFGTCLSRIYFAVHFPSQVAVGIFVALAVLAVVLMLEKKCLAWFLPKPLSAQVGWLFTCYLLILLSGVAAYFWSLNGWEMPATWAEAAATVDPDTSLHVLSLTSFLREGSLLLGLTVGTCIAMRAQLPQLLDSRRSWLIFKIAAGLLVGLAIWVGFGMLADPLESYAELAVQAIRGLVFGIWITLAWPALARQKLA